MSSLKEFVDHIIEDGIITADEHQRFTDRIHQDGEIDAEESEQLSRVFRLISEGKVKIVDEETEGLERDAIEEAKGKAVEADQAARELEEQRKTEIEVSRQDKDAIHRQKEIQEIAKSLEGEREAGRNKIAEFLDKSEK